MFLIIYLESVMYIQKYCFKLLTDLLVIHYIKDIYDFY